MKIGIFTESYLPQLDGVATSFVEATANALEKRGHEVYIVAPRHPRYLDQRKNVFRLYSIKVVKKPEIRLSVEVPEKALFQLMKTQFDVIHGFPGLAGITFAGLQIAWMRNIPIVGTFHTFFVYYTHYVFNGKVITPAMNEWLCTTISNRFDYLIAPTLKVKQEMIRSHIVKPIVVVPTGVDVERYVNTKKGFLRKKLSLSTKTKILLYVGRIGREKSVEFLIRSFQIIAKQDKNVVLVLVGEGPDRSLLQNLTHELQIEKRVYFTGPINHTEINKVYKDADLFVFASQTETQGMVILEAFASGLPVVAVKDEVFHSILEHGRNSLLSAKESDMFAKQVIKLLTDKKMYRTFSKNALITAQKFSIDKTAETLEKLYMMLIEQKRKHGRRVALSGLVRPQKVLQEIWSKLAIRRGTSS